MTSPSWTPTARSCASCRIRLDLRTLVGNAAHPSVLEQAGIADTDMLLAVTQSDEVNLVACKLAASLYNTPTRIARIRATDYLARPEVFSADNFCVDFPFVRSRYSPNTSSS